VAIPHLLPTGRASRHGSAAAIRSATPDRAARPRPPSTGVRLDPGSRRARRRSRGWARRGVVPPAAPCSRRPSDGQRAASGDLHRAGPMSMIIAVCSSTPSTRRHRRNIALDTARRRSRDTVAGVVRAPSRVVVRDHRDVEAENAEQVQARSALRRDADLVDLIHRHRDRACCRRGGRGETVTPCPGPPRRRSVARTVPPPANARTAPGPANTQSAAAQAARSSADVPPSTSRPADASGK